MSSDSHSVAVGVVEGFYGRPWTQSERFELFNRFGNGAHQYFVYAPKDDRKHRAQWRLKYSDAELNDIKALLDECKRRDIAFVYGLAPGLGNAKWCATDDSDFEAEFSALRRSKIDELNRIGVVHFALLFDDIDLDDGADERARVAACHARVANRLAATLHGDSSAVWLCPTVYCEQFCVDADMLRCTYLKALGNALVDDVAIMWTGPSIVSRCIDAAHIEALAGVVGGRRVVIWDNLVANDYDAARCYLGPYRGRDSLFASPHVAAILLNPNCEFALNFVPLHCMSAMQRGGGGGAASVDDALESALVAWHSSGAFDIDNGDDGKPSERALSLEQLWLLVDALYLPFEHGARAQRLLDLYTRYCMAASLGNAEREELLALCRAIIAVYERLTLLADRELLYALYARIWALKEEALLMIAFVECGATKLPGSCDHKPLTYRGGLLADLRRQLPMNHDDGSFSR
jgi:protein O-GlcNAcase / histone acetyltransferase